MTDNEIIKTLECCTYQHGRCTSCPLYAEVVTGCQSTLFDNALYLINRQKAEIEELKKGFTADADFFASEYDSKIKSEAIKDFAKELKNCFAISGDYLDIINIIDNLVKEMTEVNEK